MVKETMFDPELGKEVTCRECGAVNSTLRERCFKCEAIYPGSMGGYEPSRSSYIGWKGEGDPPDALEDEIIIHGDAKMGALIWGKGVKIRVTESLIVGWRPEDDENHQPERQEEEEDTE